MLPSGVVSEVAVKPSSQEEFYTHCPDNVSLPNCLCRCKHANVFLRTSSRYVHPPPLLQLAR